MGTMGLVGCLFVAGAVGGATKGDSDGGDSPLEQVAAKPEGEDSSGDAVASTVEHLVGDALEGHEGSYRLAVADAVLLGIGAVVRGPLRPTYGRIFTALGIQPGLALVERSDVTAAASSGPTLTADDMVSVLAFAKRADADGVLLLPGLADGNWLLIRAEWVDAAAGQVVAAATFATAAPVSSTDAACIKEPACPRKGVCSAGAGACVVRSNADCAQSMLCNLGLCTAHHGKCVVGSDADCRSTKMCRVAGRCVESGGKCVVPETAAAAAATAATSVTKSKGPKEKRRSWLLMAVGLGGVGLGVGCVAAGGLMHLLASADTRVCSGSGANETCRPITPAERRDFSTAGNVLLISAGVLAVAGTVFAIIGATKVPVESKAKPENTAALPSVAIGPGALALTWRF